MQVISLRAPFSSLVGSRRARGACAIVAGLALSAGAALAAFAQMSQAPQRAPRPIISPEANRMPDANDQMIMREKNAARMNFNAANAERLKELMKASDALETLAMAMKAEVDKPEGPNPDAMQKAETIEKLARIVKEKMTLTVAAN